ncbi:MAG: NifU N-terminal domain-containing protein, partial [Bdellovibrionales bacterium]|nr:NifU N-terminal domain-containing protein [Bdellovibrionales bacterium]
MLNYDVLIRTMPTPNPSAFKFVVNCPLKVEGKASFNSKSEAQGISLVEALFDMPGVLQVHLFENVMTITYVDGADVDKLNQDATAILQTRLAIHDPKFLLPGEQQIKKSRENLTPEM